jgi:hypothetical protein
MRSIALPDRRHDTILDPAYRRQHHVAVAEHFYYPHCATMASKYRQNQITAISADSKIRVRGHEAVRFDLQSDPEEDNPNGCDPAALERLVRTPRNSSSLNRGGKTNRVTCWGI